MSFVKIQCRLVVSESIRRQLWHLMANKNTPLVNELLKSVSQHDRFEVWQRSSKVPVEQLLWQAKLLAKPAAMPYPILLGSQGGLRWSINEKGRICVAFNGMDKAIAELKRNPFQIYGDRHQLRLLSKCPGCEQPFSIPSQWVTGKCDRCGMPFTTMAKKQKSY
jgi:hypothetical protein